MPSTADLVIKGGTVVTPSSTFRAALTIRDGKIEDISSDQDAPSAERVIDAEGLHVLPGIIDVHVHFRDPGSTHKEDFASGSAAAAAGGVTTVFEMPNTVPPTKDAGALEAKAAIAGSKSVVDYGLYGLLTVGSLAEVGPMARGGAVGFKCYMAETTGKVQPPSDGELLDQLAEARRAGLRVAVHAEDDSIVQYRIAKLRAEGKVYPRAHYESRPAIAEEEAVRRALLCARDASCPIHVAHLSSSAGALAVREAKRAGLQVTAETAPHYLLLDESRYPELGPLMKVNPSIKTAADRAALWDALNDGTVDTVAADHSPHLLEEKKGDVIFDCPSGFPALETSVPLMLTQVNRGMLTLERYVRVTSENPARAWNVYPRKGCLEVGSDADVTIVDMKARGRVDPSRFQSKAKWSPFEGFEVQGQPVYTVVRGRVVMDHGAVDTAPHGAMVRPSPL